ncbi:MAG: dipeptide/oligopeptide/nickel ABC transporter ATP-binding protein, partial [Clostridiales bacterium]|nr:dipeptide/oligopeptide/nickel ABC transporter ATP-binding protein [Clostridiales bacterium]
MALIEVEHLKKHFTVAAGVNHAVDDITFKIEKGHTMGVVGESGCGKSTLGRTIIRLHDATSGKVMLDGEDITFARGKKLRELREKMSIVFQDPYSSLNPRMTVESTIMEPLQESHRFSKQEIQERAEELMDLAGIEKRLRLAYPHEMDGGRRQRVGIARAIALNP